MDTQRQTGNIYIDLQLHSFIVELQRHVNFSKISTYILQYKLSYDIIQYNTAVPPNGLPTNIDPLQINLNHESQHVYVPTSLDI